MNNKSVILLLVLGIAATCLSLAKAESQPGYFEDNSDDFMDFDADEEEFENVARPSADKPGKESISDEKMKEQDIPDAVVEEVPFTDNDEDEATVESEDEFLNDEEEFIGFSSDSSSTGSSRGQQKKETLKEPRITIADVPLHLRSNWDSFYLELILFAGLVVYFANFSIGRNKNFKLASAWFESHKSLLMHHFALVGDDGKVNAPDNGAGGPPSESKSVVTSAGGCAGLQKENENLYSLYCSGRVSVHSMLVELKFIKRQDVASLIANIFRPSNDEVVIKLRLDDMDSFVMCLAAKKVASKYTKDMNDIITYCPGERRSLPPKYFTSSLASKFVVMSEIGEASQAILGDQVSATMLNKFLGQLNYLHISDQYAGPKQPDQDQQVATEKTSDVQKMPEVHKMIILSLQMVPPKDGKSSVEAVENLKPMMMMVLHMADKIYRLRLGKDAKLKAKKNRSKVEEAFHKATHAARAERAQGIREEKKREAREKMMEIDDPEKQRKWEERENKKAAKKRNPRMKPIKVAK